MKVCSLVKRMKIAAFVIFGWLMISGTADADILRSGTPWNAPNHAPAGLSVEKSSPSFPESPLLELRDRMEGWMVQSMLLAGKWRGDVETRLRDVLGSRRLEVASPCNEFLTRALRLLFGVRDFDFPGLPEKSLGANGIARYVANHPEQWTLLGAATSQLTLERAQAFANLNRPVIAVYSTVPHGHVALVMPGTLQYSSQWNLNVPNSASVFLNMPHKSYVGLALSHAFQASHIQNVKLYTRNYPS